MSTVISIENLYKEYRLGIIGHGTLYRDLQSSWAKMRGGEDPNSLIEKGPVNAKGNILALNNINLEVKHGEILGIIGRNGAGKSTLLKILSRVTAPSSGLVKIRGRIASLLEVGTGFHPELTGRENIYLNGAIHGMNRKEVSLKLEEIVDFAGVEKFLDTPVKRYSTGMHVRLGFAVAAHLEPEILVVDEVLAVGDASFQKKAIGKMQDVSKGEGRTVLFVSHNMQSVKTLCQSAILLHNGKMIYHGECSEVVDKYIRSADVTSLKTLLSSDYKRSKNVDGSVRFTDLRVLDEQGKERGKFFQGEKVNIFFEITAFRDRDYLSLNVGVLSSRTSEPMSRLTKCISDKPIKKGDKEQYIFELETSGMAYGFFPLFFELNGKKGHEDYDFISKDEMPPLHIINDDYESYSSSASLFHINSRVRRITKDS